MKRQSLFVLLLLVLAVMLLPGCLPFMSRTKTTTLTDLDGRKKVVEEEKGFFASENLEAYYEHENKRIENYTRVIEKKIEAINAIAERRASIAMTPSEALMAGVIDTLSITIIKEAAPLPANPAPRTMGDYLGPQTVALAQIAVGGIGAAFDWDTGWVLGGSNSGEGSTSMKEVTIAGDFYNNSERRDQYYLEEGSAWGGTESPTLSWTYETYTGNSTNSGQEGTASASSPTDKDIGVF